MARTNKAGLFVRCTEEEAESIRRDAKRAHRTLSGYILNAVISRIETKDKLLRGPATQPENPKRSSAQKSFLA